MQARLIPSISMEPPRSFSSDDPKPWALTPGVRANRLLAPSWHVLSGLLGILGIALIVLALYLGAQT